MDIKKAVIRSQHCQRNFDLDKQIPQEDLDLLIYQAYWYALQVSSLPTLDLESVDNPSCPGREIGSPLASPILDIRQQDPYAFEGSQQDGFQFPLGAIGLA